MLEFDDEYDDWGEDIEEDTDSGVIPDDEWYEDNYDADYPWDK